ncbi:MAG: anthranilate phosphoribosyltransferase, partial [Pseudomonadota bacterium]
ARAIQDLLDGQAGPFRDVVCLNAGCALHVLGRAANLEEGALKALDAIETGAARATLTKLVNLSHGREA